MDRVHGVDKGDGYGGQYGSSESGPFLSLRYEGRGSEQFFEGGGSEGVRGSIIKSEGV